MRAPTLKTDRLRLRAITLDDVEACLAMDFDPEVHRYFFLDGVPNPDMHRAYLRARFESELAKPSAKDGLRWGIEWLETPGWLGWVCLVPLEKTGLIEIGYRLISSVWGQGIATEAAGTVLDYGFREIGFDPIVGTIHPDNAASVRVLHKIGMKHMGTEFHYGLDGPFFRLSRAEYEELVG
ncbi:MAG: GNAT family N-acetyltransferase [Alphaproteobacteria bacterium]|nr:GNAT family N-acetyltransferase [Alphaproteobacteria bacterium]